MTKENMEILPVNPSFLLHVGQVQRLRFFFSALTGEAPRNEISQ